MFSEAYIEELKKPENQFIQTGWEPGLGHCAYHNRHGVGVMFHPYFGTLVFENVIRDCPKGDLLFLPTLRQLLDMLEERGWAWKVGQDPWQTENMTGERCKGYKITVAKWDAVLSDAKSTDDRDFLEDIEGPDPETAALRCLSQAVGIPVGGEVVKDEITTTR